MDGEKKGTPSGGGACESLSLDRHKLAVAAGACALRMMQQKPRDWLAQRGARLALTLAEKLPEMDLPTPKNEDEMAVLFLASFATLTALDAAIDGEGAE